MSQEIKAPQPAPPLSDGFDGWWADHRIKRVLNPAGVARMVWEASARYNRKTVLGATESTSGFYPEDEGSIPSGQANSPAPEGALHAFKNFHQRLCERFGYFHDEQDWQRDLCSLEEHIAALAAPAPQALTQEPAVWLVLDRDGSLIHAAAWREGAHDHINDAINEHGISEAARWVVRPAFIAPQTKEPTNDR